MPTLMDLRRDQSAPTMPEYKSKRLMPFAIHAIGCIQAHDALKESGTPKSLPELCAADGVLSQPEVVVERYMLCAFGRNSLPVFTRILDKECNQNPESYLPQVQAVKEALIRTLH